MEKACGSLSTKSETAGAIRYTLSHWRALTRYVDDGFLEIDNSAAERALRAVAIGRKNYLFLGSDSGGQRAASLYSLIGTAKLNGLDPALRNSWLSVLEDVRYHPVSSLRLPDRADALFAPAACCSGQVSPLTEMNRPLGAALSPSPSSLSA
jgi:transposase